jgi:hypothetical protein
MQARHRARTIVAQQIKERFQGRRLPRPFIIMSLESTIQTQLFEEHFAYDVLSLEERQAIVEEALMSETIGMVGVALIAWLGRALSMDSKGMGKSITYLIGLERMPIKRGVKRHFVARPFS